LQICYSHQKKFLQMFLSHESHGMAGSAGLVGMISVPGMALGAAKSAQLWAGTVNGACGFSSEDQTAMNAS
jgi:hypothetical protein